MMNKTTKLTAVAVSALLTATTARAAEITTNTAIMQAMDKITGHVDLIEVPVNQEVFFGTLSIVVRECKTRSPEETPENFAFVDVVDKNTVIGDVNIFKGWMISSSPALNPLAHPVYDVWLLKCMNKLVDPKDLMTKEQLEARDEIVMNRDATEKTLNEQEQPKEDLSVFHSADGEPINLIPDDVSEDDTKTEENNTQKHKKTEEQASAPQLSGEKEEGAPQALIDFSAQETVEAVDEDNSQEPEFETIDVSASPEQSAPKETTDQPATATDTKTAKQPDDEKKQSVPASANSEKSEQTKNTDKKEETVTKQPVETPSSGKSTDNEEKPENVIDRLEQELSEQLSGE